MSNTNLPSKFAFYAMHVEATSPVALERVVCPSLWALKKIHIWLIFLQTKKIDRQSSGSEQWWL